MALNGIMLWAKGVRENFTPVLKESQFIEKGMLTPEEFVRAGDQLVTNFPSWEWQRSQDPSKNKSYLPADKQYLITRGVPSFRRVSSMQAATDIDHTITGDNGDEWCAPEMLPFDADFEEEVMIEADDIESDGISEASSVKKNPVSASIDTIVESTATLSTASDDGAAGLQVPIAAMSISSTKESSSPAIVNESGSIEDDSLALDESTDPAAMEFGHAGQDCSILRSRRYDVSITYDNYYRTPRIWLFGYDENGSALTPHAIFQDVMQDYKNKTVTIDPHPHLPQSHASIHPCQHANAMLTIIQALVDAGRVPEVDQYLFIFLKFIQSVVPTIEYDFTIDVQARGK